MWNAGDVAVRAVRRSFRNDSGQEEKIDDFFESITLADLLKESDSGKAE